MTRKPPTVGLTGFAVAAAIFLASWWLLDHGFYAHGRISDTGVYQSYGLQMRGGQLPYRDFAVEYPPGSLVVFVAPTYVGHPTVPHEYERWFAVLMAVAGLVALAAVVAAGAPRRGVTFVAVSPLIVGSLMLTRFDLWPVALTALAVAGSSATATGRVARPRARDRREALPARAGAARCRMDAQTARRARARWGIGVWLAALLAVFAPFAVLSPHGLWRSIWGQFTRPIQLESLVATVFTTLGHPAVVVSHSSLAIAGHGTLAAVTTIVEVVALIALWAGFAPASRRSSGS